VVQGFVNSRDPERGVDAWHDADHLRDFLVESNLLDAGVDVTGVHLDRAKQIREALRALLLANAGEELTPADVEALSCVSGRVCLGVDDGGRARLVADTDTVDGAFAGVMAIVMEAMADGTWDRLKACRRHSCLWAFYDRSKNKSGQWCSMKVCGNREKTREYRERRRATTG
ncbi:MAG TPA: CGNR zinc finger domain-containing protein, partial [Actinomycetota bacterium]|nr:CGNR zinc finger domain-containing protein [Actinomycetota bacterium]